eukprot:15457275-Alexandrium_andersonii.AAC.1
MVRWSAGEASCRNAQTRPESSITTGDQSPASKDHGRASCHREGKLAGATTGHGLRPAGELSTQARASA